MVVLTDTALTHVSDKCSVAQAHTGDFSEFSPFCDNWKYNSNTLSLWKPNKEKACMYSGGQGVILIMSVSVTLKDFARRNLAHLTI